MTTAPHTSFVVLDSSAKMPASCWGRYRRVAVLSLAAGVARPGSISDRAEGVEIVATWERLHVGTSERCAYRIAIVEAQAMAVDENKRAARLYKRRLRYASKVNA